MQTTKQAERDAKKLLRLCLVDGSLDEARVRQVVRPGDRVRPVRRARRPVAVSAPGAARQSQAQRRRWTAPRRCRPTCGQRIEAALGADATGRTVTTSFAENPALIGGVRIKVGSDVYDGSVQGHLAALESRF